MKEKDSKTNSLHEDFRDLLQEVPEAERALRDYRALRHGQSRDAAIVRMRERELRHQEEAWNALREQLRASGMNITDSIH
jgi:predicted RNase H-like nuclease (RuvC/YqgF family)